MKKIGKKSINNKNNNNTLCINNKYMERKDKITSFFSRSKYVPMTKKEIANVISVPKDEMYILDAMLDELVNSGKVICDKTKRYVVLNEKDKFKCKFQAKTENFGFGIIIGSDEEDIYIPGAYINSAMDGDEVLVVLDTTKKFGNHRKVGKIVSILSRKITKVVGQVYKIGKKCFVDSIDSRIPSISLGDEVYETGTMVEVKVIKYPNRKANFTGKVTRVICDSEATNAYVKALYIGYDLDKKETFNKEVKKELLNIPSEVSKEDLIGRVDRTGRNVYTIDSEDAKDLDDAISVSKRTDGTYDLSVYIADVSHYVKDGTSLDKEAIERATSIYIPGSVIPMLPKELSNGICSLNEGVIRLTLSVDMHIDTEGNVIDDNIYKGYIRSKKKMTYEKVFKCIEKSDEKVLEEYRDYLKDIDLMKEIASVLNNKRVKMGSINFDIPETKVVLDSEGNVIDVHPYEVNISNKIIEEFMLITNMTVAKKFLHLGAPFIYRIHEKPDEEKLRNLNEILVSYGKKLRSIDNIRPRMIAEVMEDFESEEEKKVLSTIALRTLKLAVYDSECLGHFGLSFKYYCHFTSPIRRYPDLFIHRVISSYLENNYILSDKLSSKYSKQALIYSDISTEKEKEATRIERDFDDLHMAIFMKDKIGSEFEATVSSVTSFGMFVKLESTVEGLVHIKNMPGYYEFDEKKYLLIGNNVTYRIGDKVKVILDNVDVRNKEIDFILAK